jgi:uncharacterized protein YjbI with pentapeptide repeats
MDVLEFVERIDGGEWDFQGEDLICANLTDAVLCTCTLEGAILARTLQE